MSTDGTNWVAATSTPTSGNDTVTIRNGHTVTVTANVTGDQVTVDSGGTLTVNNGVTFTLNDGTGTDMIVIGTAAFVDEGVVSGASSTFLLSSFGTLNVGSANGITNFPSATGNIQTLSRNFDSGAIYVYNGSAAQATGNALPTTLSGNLTINNTAGVTLSQTTTHNGTLTLTNGILATGANTLAIGGGAIVNRTNGYVNGNLQRTFNAAASRTFDVGTANGYSPVAVNATAGTFPATFTVKATQGGMPGISGTNKLARYWTLTNSTVTSANLTFTYLASDVTGTVANYKFIKNSGGTLTTLNPTGTPTTTSATINGVTSFSDWTLAEPSAIQYGSFQFNSATYNVSETAGTATITVSRTGGSDSAVSVDYATVAGGTATGGATCVGAPTFTDYLSTSGTLSFAAGETSKTFDVTICNEIAYEPNDTVNLQLSNAQGGATLGSPTDATLTITSEDAAPTIGILDVTAAEGNAGTTNFTFNIFRSGSPSQDPINIAYHTANGSAVAPGDYTAVASGNATISSFGPSVNVTVSVNGDTTPESNETFTVELDSTSVGTFTDTSGLGTITNDDPFKYRSAASGNWNSNSTWETSPDGVTWSPAASTPTAATADTIQIQNTHTVTVTASVDADQMTMTSSATLTVNNGVTFTVADGTGTDLTSVGTVRTAGQITNNGQVIIHGTLQIDQGGFPGGGTGTYSYNQSTDPTQGVLVFNNTSGSYGVNNDNYWPTTNGPQKVNVAGAGGITMNVARTVGVLFQYAAGVSSANNLTLNGTSQVNNGGFMSGSPTYGSSSLLKYNVNASYGRNGEWLPNVTSGAGYPASVQLSNNTNLDLPNGSAGAFFQMSGILTIDSGSTMNLNGSPAMTQPLKVLSNVQINGTLTLSTASGGDIQVGGHWTRSGVLNANGRAVTFNGEGGQTIALGSAGTESFPYLIVDKPSGALSLSSSPATSLLVTSPSGGSALQIINEGGIDLNGNGLTLNGSVAGTNILVGGATASTLRNITGAGVFAVTNGAKSVTNNNGKTLEFGPSVNVSLFQPMDFGASLTTIDGTLTLGSGGSVNTNAPTYGIGSTLVYDCTCVYARSTEWSATSGPGYPYNVQVNTNTDVNIGGGSPGTAKQIAGTLDAKSGGRFLMDFPGSEMTAPLTVLTNVLIESGGTLALSTATGGDLKVQGNFTNTGTFTPNNRAVFFEGGNTQDVADISLTVTMPYVRINKSGGTVRLQNNMTTLGPSGGDSITFTGATSTLTLNGRTLTLGSTIGTPPAGSGLIGDNSATLSLVDGGTTGAMGTISFVSGGQSLSTLTINRTGANASATLGSDLQVVDALNLTSGDINTGSNIITQGGTSSGIGDVVGNVRRFTFITGPHLIAAEQFGNPNVQLSFQSGTPAAEVTVNLVKSVPTGAGFGYPGAVQRTYTVTQTGASGFTATLRLHYLNSELNGNTEALLDLWRFNGTTWSRVPKTGADILTANNKWIESSAVTQFSPWTLAQGNALTESRLASFSATQNDAGTVLTWQTGYEVDNLGFNLYREVSGRRTLVNPALIAGSALITGPKIALTAGNSYTWTDYTGGTSARYYLEEINLAGQSKTYGPYTPTRVGGRLSKGLRSPTISMLTDDAQAQDAQRQWTRNDAARAELTRASGGASDPAQEKQRWLASRPAVKIAVRSTGWYHVTREQLTAAGLSASADPARLQLYAGGVEVPIRVGADGSVEFYGQGLDVQSTDTRVYWLVEGDTAGLRTNVARGTSPGSTEDDDSTLPGGGTTSGGGESDGGQTNGATGITIVPVDPPFNGPESFNYTVERRERTVYFSGLQNGEAENFFGKVVNATAATQTLTVRNLLQVDAQTATLEVSLQGLTTGEHHVSVSFNGASLGTLDFAGQTNKSATFTVEGYMLHEGDNQVQLVAAGAGDVSLTDRLRLTYLHSMNADDDRLRFSAPAGPVRVGGFSSPSIRVIDVTDPAAPFEVQLDEDAVPDAQGGWSIGFNVTGGERELFAFADAQVSQPASVVANAPSTWSADAGQQADMVVVTHGNFTEQVAPLVAERTAEGLNVKVVDVEDLFDEFSYGAHTPQAVRDFLAWTKANWEKAPAYVLLVGDGSYDPRDYLGRGRYDLVPSKLLDAGAMETASDDWFADFDDDGIADLAVGRLPVRTPAEASTVVSKIISRTFDPTQTSALLVADRDGPDGYNFEAATDGVQALLPAGTNVARVNRRAQDAATVRGQIVAGVNAGPLVVNWMGHGSIDVWTGDGLLRGSDAPSLQNGSRLPLFVMMTCLNGYYEGTGLDSLAEAVLKAQQGGAYAVWASSGMTEPNAQAETNRELYRIIFAEGGAVRLGDAVRRAKAATADRDVRRTWVFFGDPSSRLR